MTDLLEKWKGQRQESVSWSHSAAAGKEGINGINQSMAGKKDPVWALPLGRVHNLKYLMCDSGSDRGLLVVFYIPFFSLNSNPEL